MEHGCQPFNSLWMAEKPLSCSFAESMKSSKVTDIIDSWWKSILWISAYLTEKHQIGFATSHPFRSTAPSGHVEADNQDTMSSHEVLHPGLWNFVTNGNLKTGLVVSSWNHDISREVHKSWLVVSNIFYFHPYLGKISDLTNIFQIGWNHHLVSYCIMFVTCVHIMPYCVHVFFHIVQTLYCIYDMGYDMRLFLKFSVLIFRNMLFYNSLICFNCVDITAYNLMYIGWLFLANYNHPTNPAMLKMWTWIIPQRKVI